VEYIFSVKARCRALLAVREYGQCKGVSMTRPEQQIASTIRSAFFFLLLISAAQAQQFQVIHDFMNRGDGGDPYSGLTPFHGKFFGTTSGTVFSLESEGSSWILNTLFNLPGYPYSGGSWIMAKVVVGPDGALYGTTYEGGVLDGCAHDNGCGVVFKLQPPATFCHAVQCFWKQTVLHTFTGGADGGNPISEVVFDRAGNLYGTTPYGGNTACPYGCGVVYKMMPSAGGWTQIVIYNFTGGSNGAHPSSGLIFDQAGNLYGAADEGTGQAGIIYELTPSNGGWTETVLHNFQPATDGAGPQYSLVADASGNMYGVTYGGGPASGGTVYEWSPSGGGTFSVLYSFGLAYGEPSSPSGTPVFDGAGNLYGTTSHGGTGFLNFGTVYKLSPSSQGWKETDLHTFIGNDGIFPFCSVVLDQQGRLYGTASMGGGCCGTVWQLTP
jgi:uncharacterized repeat protein (TIGR03803 family)